MSFQAISFLAKVFFSLTHDLLHNSRLFGSSARKGSVAVVARHWRDDWVCFIIYVWHLGKAAGEKVIKYAKQQAQLPRVYNSRTNNASRLSFFCETIILFHKVSARPAARLSYTATQSTLNYTKQRQDDKMRDWCETYPLHSVVSYLCLEPLSIDFT